MQYLIMIKIFEEFALFWITFNDFTVKVYSDSSKQFTKPIFIQYEKVILANISTKVFIAINFFSRSIIGRWTWCHFLKCTSGPLNSKFST